MPTYEELIKNAERGLYGPGYVTNDPVYEPNEEDYEGKPKLIGYRARFVQMPDGPFSVHYNAETGEATAEYLQGEELEEYNAKPLNTLAARIRGRVLAESRQAIEDAGKALQQVFFTLSETQQGYFYNKFTTVREVLGQGWVKMAKNIVLAEPNVSPEIENTKTALLDILTALDAEVDALTEAVSDELYAELGMERVKEG